MKSQFWLERTDDRYFVSALTPNQDIDYCIDDRAEAWKTLVYLLNHARLE